VRLMADQNMATTKIDRIAEPQAILLGTCK
jgi:hypothetical protein